MDSGQLARFRQWQDRTVHVHPRVITRARRQSALAAIAGVCIVAGVALVAIWAYGLIGLVSLIGGIVPLGTIVFAVWRHASLALSEDLLPGPPRLPAEFRLCPVCGSILRVRQLEYGWTAVCPACGYRLSLED